MSGPAPEEKAPRRHARLPRTPNNHSVSESGPQCRHEQSAPAPKEHIVRQPGAATQQPHEGCSPSSNEHNVSEPGAAAATQHPHEGFSPSSNEHSVSEPGAAVPIRRRHGRTHRPPDRHSARLLFVTGTSTEVGKTVTTAALAATARAAGVSVAVCKPAQTGVGTTEPGDLAMITALSGVTRTLESVRYPDPLAPATAARRCGAPLLTLSETASAVSALGSTADLVLVEGAGGLLVRLGEFTLLDLARELAAPVLVVAAAGLGTLNHSELTTWALRQEGVRCAGLVIGSWPEQPDLAARTNRTDLPRVTGAELVGAIPAGAGSWAPPRFRSAAPGWFDQKWARQYLGLAVAESPAAAPDVRPQPRDNHCA